MPCLGAPHQSPTTLLRWCGGILGLHCLHVRENVSQFPDDDGLKDPLYVLNSLHFVHNLNGNDPTINIIHIKPIKKLLNIGCWCLLVYIYIYIYIWFWIYPITNFETFCLHAFCGRMLNGFGFIIVAHQIYVLVVLLLSSLLISVLLLCVFLLLLFV